MASGSEAMPIPSVYSAAASLTLAVSVFSSPALAAETSHGLTPETRSNFLALAETSLRAQAKVAAEFWDWLDQRPSIRAGLLSSESPVPAEFAENLDSLRHALGADSANRYAELLLGVSLGEPQTKGGDGAYLATAVSLVAEPDADLRVKKVADYLKQHHLTVVDFIAQQDAMADMLSGMSVERRSDVFGFALDSLDAIPGVNDEGKKAFAEALQGKMEDYFGANFTSYSLRTIQDLTPVTLCEFSELLVKIQSLRSATSSGPVEVGGQVESMYITREAGVQWISRMGTGHLVGSTELEWLN